MQLIKVANKFETKLHKKADMEKLHLILDVAGLIPGVGEIADAANGLLYLTKGDYFLALLCLISMVPTVGDALGKGTKLAMWLNKLAPKTVEALGKVKKHYPEIKKAILAAKALFVEYKPEIDELIEKVMNGEKLKNWTDKDPEIKTKLKRVKLKLDDIEEIFEKSSSILDSLKVSDSKEND